MNLYKQDGRVISQEGGAKVEGLDYLSDDEVRQYLQKMESADWEAKRQAGFTSQAIRDAKGNIIALDKNNITEQEQKALEALRK